MLACRVEFAWELGLSDAIACQLVRRVQVAGGLVGSCPWRPHGALAGGGCVEGLQARSIRVLMIH